MPQLFKPNILLAVLRLCCHKTSLRGRTSCLRSFCCEAGA